MSIVELHKARPCDDIVAGLRRLADRIERGDVDGPISTCVVVTGHSVERHTGGEDIEMACDWTTFAYGPRSDIYTVRGLMMTAAMLGGQ